MSNINITHPLNINILDCGMLSQIELRICAKLLSQTSIPQLRGQFHVPRRKNYAFVSYCLSNKEQKVGRNFVESLASSEV